MIPRRLSLWMLAGLAAALTLAGCEPYMSMTDQIPAQTRQAMTLLPASPRYAGMVDLETVMTEADVLTNGTALDSLRQAEPKSVRVFLDATGMDPATDLKAVYAALGKGSTFSAVVFADLSPAQMDRYLDRVPEAGRATTYDDIPVYRLRTGIGDHPGQGISDTLSLAFVDGGVVAASMDAGTVRAMIDRRRSQSGGLRGNTSYMTLVERVGHGSTAWLVGRDVLQTALRDSAGRGDDSAPDTAASSLTMSEAGLQQLLSGWADRVLGMSEDAPSLDRTTGGKVKELGHRIREQAVSVTLTDEALEGEMYLTMRDETSAANVVDVSKGALAALRLSDQKGEGLKDDLLEGVTVERNGPVVHVQFSVGRKHLQQTIGEAQSPRAACLSIPSIRRATVPPRRSAGITPDLRAI